MQLDEVDNLLARHGISQNLAELIPLTGGANNRVFRLKGDAPLVLKQYFTHPQDTRPRLKNEFSFLTYAWNCGIQNIPQPIAYDPETNTGIYTFVEGKPFTHSSSEAVDEAISFLLALNHSKDQGKHLPLASEACLTASDYFALVEKRLDKLIQLEDPDLNNFLTKELIPAWNHISQSTLHAPLPFSSLCITPSDFGFHNAIQGTDKVFFIDFEYAGWDDPVKTVCDFFSQPKIPVSLDDLDHFVHRTASLVEDSAIFAERIRILLPVCRIKWCCMMLSGFFGIGKARRDFARFETTKAQLKKTQTYLQESLCLI